MMIGVDSITKDKNIRISFIIPTYNCATYLNETLQSVLSQMPNDCELIIVDDGSDEDTVYCLKSYEGICDQMKIIFNKHHGVSVARNTGMDAAHGKFISFMDCDDMLQEGFFLNILPVLETKADMYIFSFDRINADGAIIPFVVDDKVYESVSDFADEYIRNRHLLIYSACNKLYRKEVLDRNGIRFREDISFGEDRLFNYDCLQYCEKIITSKTKMFNYMQRNDESASKRSFHNYFDTIMMLHHAKTDCFIGLSKGCSDMEKADFVGYDLSTEIRHMLDRFDKYEDEKAENLPRINQLLFGETADFSGAYGRETVLDKISKTAALSYIRDLSK